MVPLRRNRILRAMSGFFGKLRDWLSAAESKQDGTQPREGLGRGSTDAPREGAPPGSADDTRKPDTPEDLTSVPVMIEILKLLARIEYGVDEVQIADALAVSQANVIANCEALEKEVLIHHHEGSAEWFIGQRGLQFLQLHGNLD